MTYVVSFHRDWSTYSQDNRGKEFGMAVVVIPVESCDTLGEISLRIREQLSKNLRTSKESITVLNFWRGFP